MTVAAAGCIHIRYSNRNRNSQFIERDRESTRFVFISWIMYLVFELIKLLTQRASIDDTHTLTHTFCSAPVCVVVVVGNQYTTLTHLCLPAEMSYHLFFFLYIFFVFSVRPKNLPEYISQIVCLCVLQDNSINKPIKFIIILVQVTTLSAVLENFPLW